MIVRLDVSTSILFVIQQALFCELLAHVDGERGEKGSSR